MRGEHEAQAQIVVGKQAVVSVEGHLLEELEGATARQLHGPEDVHRADALDVPLAGVEGASVDGVVEREHGQGEAVAVGVLFGARVHQQLLAGPLPGQLGPDGALDRVLERRGVGQALLVPFCERPQAVRLGVPAQELGAVEGVVGKAVRLQRERIERVGGVEQRLEVLAEIDEALSTDSLRGAVGDEGGPPTGRDELVARATGEGRSLVARGDLDAIKEPL